MKRHRTWFFKNLGLAADLSRQADARQRVPTAVGRRCPAAAGWMREVIGGRCGAHVGGRMGTAARLRVPAMARRWFALSFTVLLSVLPLAARERGEYFNDIRPERLETPCYAFAADYANGPLKVLFVMPRHIAPREVVELKQRLTMEIGAVLYIDPAHAKIGGDGDIYTGAIEGTMAAEKLARLEQLLRERWDAIVFGAHIPFKSFPPKIQYEILRQVSEGTGLVALGELRPEVLAAPTKDPPGQVLSGVPFPRLGSYAGMTKVPLDQLPSELLKTFQFGKGRVATVKHLAIPWPNSLEGYWPGYHGLTPAFPYTHKERVYYDYYLSAIAKVLLWVVPSKAVTVVSRKEPPAVTVGWAELPKAVFCGAFRIPGEKNMECHLQLRDLLGGTWPLQTRQVKPGDYELRVVVPEMPRGDYFIDYRFVSAKGTEYWGSCGVMVGPPPAAIESVVCGKPRFERADSFQATVTLSQAPSAGLTLRAGGFDCDGRQVFEKTVPASSREVGVTAELTRCLVMPHHLRVELRGGGRVLDVARQEFQVAGAEPAFPSILWGDAIRTILGETVMHQVRRASFNVVLDQPGDNPTVRDLAPMQYTTRLTVPPAATSTNEVDWGYSNPTWTTTFVTNIQAKVKKTMDIGIAWYSLGDENSYSYTREKWVPSEEKAFRQYLKGVYRGDLALLNREWGTPQASFDEIPVPDLNKSMVASDIPRKNLWMNFCEKLYTDAHHIAAKAIKEIDPRARVGAEGSLPGNLEEMLDGLEMWGPYPSRLDNVLMRSFGNPRLLRGNWWGGYSAQRATGAQPIWDQVLSGGVNSSFYFATGGSEGMMSCDGSYADYFEDEQLPALREIAAGIGPLLARTPVANMGLGIFYSLPSEHALTLDTRFGSPGSCRDGLLKFCEDTGISGYFYSEKQIQSGKLVKDGIRLLFMPQSLCVSDATAGGLRKWVEEGGILVADQQTGLRNERGGLRDKGVLDDVFGVQQDRDGEPFLTAVEGQLAGVPVQWERVYVDRRVKAGTTSPAGLMVENQVPVMIKHDFGQGRAVFLNLSLGKLLSNYSEDPATRMFLLTLLERAGIFTRLQAPNGYLVVRFQGDGYELLSCRIGPQGCDGGKLVLGKAYHVYDIRRGKYLGEKRELVPSKCAGKNNLFTLLPQRARAIRVEFPSLVEPGGCPQVTVLTEPTGEGASAACLFRIRVLDPSGEERESMRCFAEGNGKPASAVLPFALNETAGKYTLEVTNILTGQQKMVRFEVKGGRR